MINWFLDKLADRISIQLRKDLIKEMAWDVFSTLGLRELEDLIQQSKDKDEKYVNMGKVYEERLRGMTIQRLENVINRLTDEPFTTIEKDENLGPTETGADISGDKIKRV